MSTQEQKFNQERLFKVLKHPVVSEKATFVAEKNNQIVFMVATDATKLEIRAAIKLIFNAEVESVQTLNRQGKQKRSGKFMGRRNHTKIAFISLLPGQDINFAERLK